MPVETTNTKHLPEPFVSAINFSDFHPVGSISLHRLCDAPQIGLLRKKNNLTDDISEKTWTLIQKALLQVIENGDRNHRYRRAISTSIEAILEIQKEDSTVDRQEGDEEAMNDHLKALNDIVNALDKISTDNFPPSSDRYLIRQSYGVEFNESYTCHKGTAQEFTTQEKRTVFDSIPLYDKQTKTLFYVRICNTFHLTKTDMRNAWVREANIQSYILEANGFPVESIVACAVMKDWTSAKVGIQQDYPKSQLETMQLPLHRKEDTEKVIKVQLRRHLRSINGDDVQCLPNERWAEADSWVVIRPNAKKPSKRCQSEKEANDYLAINRSKLVDAVVKKENGKSKRCESYCSVRDVCPQYAEIRKTQIKETTE